MSPVELTGGRPSGGVANPYTRAYRREIGSGGLTTTNDRRATNNGVQEYSVQAIWTRTIRQRANLARAQWWASAKNLERTRQLKIRVAVFFSSTTPTVSQLVDYT
jgi:hypothetical protein